MRERKRIPFKQPQLPQEEKKKYIGGMTVAQRIYNFCNNSKNPPYITLATKQTIGEIVKNKFFTPDKKNRGAYKKLVKEKEGTFNVMVYPQYFVPVIDAIIFSYFKEKKINKN